MTLRSLRLSKFTFYILFFCLPINLGLHFVVNSSYVGGLLVDYLIPTLYLQDILAAAVLAFWVKEDYLQFVHALTKKRFVPLYLLLYVVLLSVLLSTRAVPSVYIFARWFLYSLLVLYVATTFDIEKDTKFLAKTFCIWSIFLGILAIAQFIHQGSIFDNYLVLGEQPYSAATPMIDRENIFGSTKVPAYGIFKHPNVFGGFLVIAALFIIHAVKNKFISVRLFILSFCFSLAGLFLTFSYFSWLAALLGIALYLLWGVPLLRRPIVTCFALISLFGLFISFVRFPDTLLLFPSISKRIDLLRAGYASSEAVYYVFGSGINTATAVVENYLTPNNFLRFVQPPHNIFVLLLSELGVIGLCLFVFLIFRSLSKAFYKYPLYFIVLLQILLMSSYDHYFITIPQSFLMLLVLLSVFL